MSHSRAATALLLVLIAACTAAFMRAQQLKLRHSPVASPAVGQAISPGCSQEGCRPRATLRFTLRRALTISLAIVDEDGRVVRTLESHERHEKGRVRLVWDGRTDDGGVAPDGRYGVRVTIPDRDITFPDPVLVDTQLPGITIDRIERGPTIRIHYTKQEGDTRAMMAVRHDGEIVLERRIFLPIARLPHSELPPGHSVVELFAVDRAGNRTLDPPSFPVNVR